MKLRILELETQLDREKEANKQLTGDVSDLRNKVTEYDQLLKTEAQTSASLREALEAKEGKLFHSNFVLVTRNSNYFFTKFGAIKT